MKSIYVLGKQFFLFLLIFGLQGRLPVMHCHWGWGARGRSPPPPPPPPPNKPEGSRCSEMHSHPYQSSPTFPHILVLSPIVLTCKLPEPNYIYFSCSIIFFTDFQGSIIFFQRISRHDYLFQFYTPPPPEYLMANALEASHYDSPMTPGILARKSRRYKADSITLSTACNKEKCKL